MPDTNGLAASALPRPALPTALLAVVIAGCGVTTDLGGYELERESPHVDGGAAGAGDDSRDGGSAGSSGNVDGAVESDDCVPDPCAHGACTDGVSSYSCACDPGWAGTNCDQNIDDCTPDPCFHGTCSDGVNSFSCSCELGWTGARCDQSAGSCAQDPCVHGTCSDSVSPYSCRCESGWTGANCDLNIDDCASDPCVNGTCIDGVNSYSCSCEPGWTGTTCAQNIDDCNPNPCVQGTCTDGVNAYTCNCDDGWTGTNCAVQEEIPIVGISFLQMIMWHDNFINNGGVHRLLMGPPSSSNPEDGSWVVLLSAAQMPDSGPNNKWASVSLDAGAVVQDHGWNSVRLAFHYKGQMGGDWWIDDVCIGSSSTTCDVFAQTFDNLLSCGLSSAGWQSVIGAEDGVPTGEGGWDVQLEANSAHTAAHCQYNGFMESRYLVSPAISLP